MKKNLLLLILLAGSLWGKAQVAVQLLVDGKPGALISDFFGSASDRLQLNVVTPTARQVYFRASITRTDNAIVIENPTYKPSQPVSLNPGLNNFNSTNNSVLYKDLKGSEVNVVGLNKDALFQSQTLPEGIYQMCIYCFDYATDVQIGQGCQILNIQLLEQPRIVVPLNASEVTIAAANAPVNLQISWTPVPNAPNVRYDLKMIEVPQGVNPEEAALKTGNGSLPVKLQQTDLISPTYLITPSTGVTLDTGKTYVLQVRAHGLNLNIKNDGLSDPVYFTYRLKTTATLPPDTTKSINGPMAALNANCTVCKTALPADKTAKDPGTLTAGNTFTMAGLPVTIVSVQADAAKKTISGIGTIPFPVAPGGKVPPVQIRFQNVKINSGNVAFEGLAAEDAMPDASMLPDADGGGHRIPGSPEKWKAFAGWLLQKQATQLWKSGSVNVNVTYRLPLGISKTIGGKEQIVAITGLRMDPTQAVLDAVSGIDVLDASAGGAFIVKALDVCFNQTDLCGAATLILGQDMSFSMGKGKGIIRLKAPPVSGNLVDTSKGTYALWNKTDGLKSFQVHGQYLFDKSLIVAADKDDTVRCNLSFKSEQGWDNWLAKVQVPKFKMASDTSFRFGPADATYDHSSISNPSGISQKIVGSEGSGWTGFYMETLGMEFPAFIKSVNNPGRVSASVNKLAIDGFGVSGNLSAANILTLDNGSLDGWYFSVDNIALNVFHNSFDSGAMLGKLMLPVTKYIKDSKDKRKSLDYTCTLSNVPVKNTPDKELQFQFVVQPNDSLDFELWKATARIEKSSKINVVYAASKSLVAEAKLNGSISIEGKVAPLPKVKLDLIEVQELTFRTRSPYFSPGKTTFFGLASPEKQLGPFVFTLDKIQPVVGAPPVDLKTLQNQSAEEEIGIQFAGSVKITDISAAPKAATALTVKAKIKLAGGRFSIGDPAFQLNKIQLSAADIAGISLTGGLELFADHATYGDGFKGNLAVKFPPGFAVGSTVQFGNVKNMGYWYVDASLKFPYGTGIPLFPGTKLAGFSGGAYYHMKPSVDLSKKSDAIAGAPQKSDTKPDTSGNPAIGAIPSGAAYVPDGQTGLGIKARLYFGLQADRILTCNTGLEIGFTPSWGISLFQVSGDGHYMPDANDKGILNAAVLAKVQWIRSGNQVVNTIFDASAQVTAGNPLLSVNVPLKMHFEQPSNPLWHLKLGQPRTPADALAPKGSPRPDAAYIELLGGLARAEGYFAVGNYDMPTSMPPVPKYILDILAKSKGGGDNSADDAAAQNEMQLMKGDFADKVSNASGTKPAILFGASQEFHLDKTIAIIYIKADAGYGFDAMLRNYAATCPGVGLNGWYASAQAYAGIDAALGVRVKFLGASFQQEFLSAGIAAILSGGLPNTTFLNGEAGGYYSVLDGAITGSFNVSFKLGNKPDCNMTTSALANVELINSITPDDGTTDVPLTIKPEVKFTFRGDAPFTLSDVKEDGSMGKKRQFVFSKQVSPNDFDFKYGQSGGPDKNEGARVDYLETPPGGTESKYSTATFIYTNEYSPPPHSNTLVGYINKLPKPLTQARIKVIARLYENQNYNGGQPGSPVKWALAREGGQIFEQTKEAKYTYVSGISGDNKSPAKGGNAPLVASAWPAYSSRLANMKDVDIYGQEMRPRITLNVGSLDPCYWSIPSASCKNAVVKARLVNLSQPANPAQLINATTKADWLGTISVETDPISNFTTSGNIYMLQYGWSWPDAAAKPPVLNGATVLENAMKAPSNFLPIYTNVFGVSKYPTFEAKVAALKIAGAYFGTKGGHLTEAQLKDKARLEAALKAMNSELKTTGSYQNTGGILNGAAHSGVSGNPFNGSRQGPLPGGQSASQPSYNRLLPYHSDYSANEPFEEDYRTGSLSYYLDKDALKNLEISIRNTLKMSLADSVMKKTMSGLFAAAEAVNTVDGLTDAEMKSGKLSASKSGAVASGNSGRSGGSGRKYGAVRMASGDDCTQALGKPVHMQVSYNSPTPKDPEDIVKNVEPSVIAVNIANIILGAVQGKKDLGRPADLVAIGLLYDAVAGQANSGMANAAGNLYGNGTMQNLMNGLDKGGVKGNMPGGNMKGKAGGY